MTKEELEKEIEALSKTVSNLKKDFDDALAKTKEISKINLEDINTKKNAIETSHTKINQLLTDVNANKTNVETAHTQIKKALTSINANKIDIVTSHTQINQLLTNATTKKTSIEATHNEINQLLTDATTKKNAIETSHTKIGEALTDANTKKADITASHTKINQLLTDVNANKTNVETAHTQIKKVLTDVNTNKTNVEAARTQIEKVLTDVNTNKTNVETARTQIGEVLTDVNTKKADIATSYTKVNQLLTDVNANKTNVETTRTQIEKVLTDANADKTKIEEFYEEQKKTHQTLFDEINDLLSGATTISLAKDYKKAVERYNESDAIWIKGFILSLSGVIITSLTSLYFSWDLKTWSDILNSSIKFVPISGALVWLAYFCSKRRSESKRLAEEYQHKLSITETYVGYEKAVEDKLGKTDPLIEKLLTVMIEASAYNPSVTLETKHGDKMPLLETIEKAVGKALEEQRQKKEMIEEKNSSQTDSNKT